MDAVRASSSGPGASDSISWRPPTRSRGSTASASTMIPMPPNHCVNCRHMESDLSRVETSATTLDPVVVMPDIASKSASTGRESWSSPDRT